MARPSERYPLAIAHDYLTQRGGAERVVLAMSRAFPEAPIYTLLYDPDGTFPEFRDRRIVTSPLNRVGPLRRHHRAALPLLPLAASRLRVPADVVLASSSGWAHAFRTDGRLIVYCHNPARWLYQTNEYLGSGWRAALKRAAFAPMRAGLVRWDRRAAARADHYLANSSVVRERIFRAYGIEAQVLFPPAGVNAQGSQVPVPELLDWSGDGYYLVVSRLLPYKNVDVVIEAFTGLDERLVVVGSGPEAERLRAMAGPNIRMLSGLTDEQLRWAYAHAAALVAPSHEDFGLTPLEANAFGKPVVALRAGGYLDTVVENVSGVFFGTPDAAALRTALLAAKDWEWDVAEVVRNAQRFSPETFSDRLVKVTGGVEWLRDPD
jgi:glycosyltransferase involved in cell wall biosynthesis